MDNNELLQAIRQVVKEEVSAQVEPIIEDIKELKQGQETLNQDVRSIKLNIENDLQRSISLLSEGHKGLSDKLSRIDKIADDIEEIKGAIVAVETIARHSV